MTPNQARRANEQIRRLRAGLQEARDTLRDHFGPDDASVKACDVALAGEVVLTPSLSRFAQTAGGRSAHKFLPWQVQLVNNLEAYRKANGKFPEFGPMNSPPNMTHEWTLVGRNATSIVTDEKDRT